MGKKKAGKNGYFYFILEKKQEMERKGYRMGNFQNVSQEFGPVWSKMTKEERLPYDMKAKEMKGVERNDPPDTSSFKFNPVVKEESQTKPKVKKLEKTFTITGESYAQMQSKEEEQKLRGIQMECFIRRLTRGQTAGDRCYIFMKAVYCIEEIINRNERAYWPSELSMTAFTMKGGIKSVYTQLVDAETIPCGYACQAKEFVEESALPLPGDRTWFRDGHRDYLGILRNINGFANHWLKDGYDVPGHRKVLFALDVEREPIKSCLQWMVNKLSGKAREKYQHFVDHLKVYPISKLLLFMAEEANRINPSYNNFLVKFKIDSSAERLLLKGVYDYCEDIACNYHKTFDAARKMHNCAQSCVMRRIYILFEEFVPAFKYEWTDRHKINKLRKGPRGPPLKKRRENPPEEAKVVVPAWLDDDEVLEDGTESRVSASPAPSGVSSTSYASSQSTRGNLPVAPPAPTVPVYNRDADLPVLGANAVPLSRLIDRRDSNSSTHSSNDGNKQRKRRIPSVSSSGSLSPPSSRNITECRNPDPPARVRFDDNNVQYRNPDPPVATEGDNDDAELDHPDSPVPAFMNSDDEVNHPDSPVPAFMNSDDEDDVPQNGGRGRGISARAPSNNFLDSDDEEDFSAVKRPAGRGRGRGGF